MTTLDLTNNETAKIGIFANSEGEYTAVTLSQSRTFKTYKGAANWMSKKGYNENGNKTKTITRAGREGIEKVRLTERPIRKDDHIVVFDGHGVIFVEEVLEEREKAVKLKIDPSLVCGYEYKGNGILWVPKAALKLTGCTGANDEVYEFELKKWFYQKMDKYTRKQLGILI